MPEEVGCAMWREAKGKRSGENLKSSKRKAVKLPTGECP